MHRRKLRSKIFYKVIKDSWQFFEIALLLSFFPFFFSSNIVANQDSQMDTICMFIKSKQISCQIHIQNHFYRQTVIIIIIICLLKSNLVLTDNTKLYEYMIYHTSVISCQVLSLFAGVVHRIHCVLYNYVSIFPRCSTVRLFN